MSFYIITDLKTGLIYCELLDVYSLLCIDCLTVKQPGSHDIHQLYCVIVILYTCECQVAVGVD